MISLAPHIDRYIRLEVVMQTCILMSDNSGVGLRVVISSVRAERTCRHPTTYIQIQLYEVMTGSTQQKLPVAGPGDTTYS
jgi:hypothetical protein